MCNPDPGLIHFFFSEGKPVGKRGAARGNVTSGRAAHPLAEMYSLTHGFSSAAVEHTVMSYQE